MNLLLRFDQALAYSGRNGVDKFVETLLRVLDRPYCGDSGSFSFVQVGMLCFSFCEIVR